MMRKPKTYEVEHHSGTVLQVLASDIKDARQAWLNSEHLVINRPTYTIEIPKDPEMEDPTNLILDGDDYIHIA